MAAIIGEIVRGECFSDSGRWELAIANLRSRIPQEFKSVRDIVEANGVKVSFTHDLYRDEQGLVWLDGNIDNLSMLSSECSAMAKESPAHAVAEIVRRHGMEALSRFEGCYVIVIANYHDREVHLIRDRIGSKSLFYTQIGDAWAWSSEVKGLTPLKDKLVVDRQAVSEAVHYRYLVGDRSLVDGIVQVLPSTIVTLRPSGVPRVRRYWDVSFHGHEHPASLESSVDDLEKVLDAHFARLRSQSDSIGILLSGGVDSSILAYKAKQFEFRRCVAFTAKWEGDNPELIWAQRVASHLGIEHQIVPIFDREITEGLPWLVYRMEEPPRHYNSFVLGSLFRAAAAEVPIVVHGEAADALYGARRLRLMQRVATVNHSLRLIPKNMQRWVGKCLAGCVEDGSEGRLRRMASYLEYDTEEYLFSINQIDHRRFLRVFLDVGAPRAAVNQRFYELSSDRTASWVERLQKHHLFSMVSNAAIHLDRLSSPFGLRVDVPFLCHESVLLGCSLPYELKVSDTGSKPVVKTLARRWFPTAWIDRRKQGFPTPLTKWLRGPLKIWIDMLAEERTRARGILDVDAAMSADVAQAPEMFWTAITLELAIRQLIDGDGCSDG